VQLSWYAKIAKNLFFANCPLKTKLESEKTAFLMLNFPFYPFKENLRWRLSSQTTNLLGHVLKTWSSF
jgi:hypothetical protein